LLAVLLGLAPVAAEALRPAAGDDCLERPAANDAVPFDPERQACLQINPRFHKHLLAEVVVTVRRLFGLIVSFDFKTLRATQKSANDVVDGAHSAASSAIGWLRRKQTL
jgi:hypothetical protein